jgi:hypothetical protein
MSNVIRVKHVCVWLTLSFCPQVKNKPCNPSSMCLFLNAAQSQTCINFSISNFVFFNRTSISNFVFVVLMPELVLMYG